MAAPTIAVTRAAPRASHGLWGDAFRRLLRNRPAMVGAALIVAFLIFEPHGLAEMSNQTKRFFARWPFEK